MKIQVRRIYESPSPSDGKRVLVDRLWPRGIRKTEASLDGWWKELAPSAELRKWFGHDPEKWGEFEKRFEQELSSNTDLIDECLKELGNPGNITLLYAAKDEHHNNAKVLAEFIKKRLSA